MVRVEAGRASPNQAQSRTRVSAVAIHEVLEAGLGQADVARLAQVEGADGLGEGALDVGPQGVARSGVGGLLAGACSL